MGARLGAAATKRNRGNLYDDGGVMHYFMDGLIIWGVLAVPAAFLMGRHLRKMSHRYPDPRAPNPPVEGLSRTERHRYDALNNPNYRGGYKP